MTRSVKLYFIVNVLTFMGGNVVMVISTFFISWLLCVCLRGENLVRILLAQQKKYKYWAECNRMFFLGKLSITLQHIVLDYCDYVLKDCGKLFPSFSKEFSSKLTDMIGNVWGGHKWKKIFLFSDPITRQ